MREKTGLGMCELINVLARNILIRSLVITLLRWLLSVVELAYRKKNKMKNWKQQIFNRSWATSAFATDARSVNCFERRRMDVRMESESEKNKSRGGLRIDVNPLLYWTTIIYLLTRWDLKRDLKSFAFKFETKTFLSKSTQKWRQKFQNQED